MHLVAVIERVLRFTWRPRSCDSEMHLEALIERVGRCTWRPWLFGIGGVHGGGRSGGGILGGRCDGSWDSIHWLTWNRGTVESLVQSGLTRDESLAGSGRQSFLRWYSTRYMLYSVCAVLGVNSISLHGEIHRDDLTLCSEVMVETERHQRRWAKPSWETGT